ncbi:two component transcriptional regulator, LuxR family [Kribbella flavida DSM 17836]|uniref:Two component transcriptional regulator, LuxR family n=1 Tax=Kribbella flavida (strain DSM 17836 / JCM 10339 / NBRC 14399) TaxID=479435 RepID=D2PS71_KRIFD|nr:response regulator transcription factor [Kribbella flavida]ADB31195.1 two component transcriptional regulator, LuxR family [Kribbella flavida DSM 17836]
MSARIGVVVAEDQSSVRAALAELVGSDPALDLLGCGATGDEAIELATRLHPDVVLMDIRMPGTDGLTATRVVCARLPATKVLVLTTFDLDEYVYEALGAGATGFLLKSAPVTDILRAIHTVHEGQAMLSPEITRRLIAEVSRGRTRRTPEAFEQLSPRELELVGAVLRGLSNEELAAELFLSLSTVKTYLSRIFSKLDVRDRTQLVILAYESGLADEYRR